MRHCFNIANDTNLKKALPEINAYFTDPLFGYVANTSVGERMVVRKATDRGLFNWIYDIFEPYIVTTYGNSVTCEKIKNL
jgi:hypothetical protein